MFDITWIEVGKLLVLFFGLSVSVVFSVFLYRMSLLIPSSIEDFCSSMMCKYREFSDKRNWALKCFEGRGRDDSSVGITFINHDAKKEIVLWTHVGNLRDYLDENFKDDRKLRGDA